VRLAEADRGERARRVREVLDLWDWGGGFPIVRASFRVESRLASEIRRHIPSMLGMARRPAIAERAVRSVTPLPRSRDQLHASQRILIRPGVAGS
jgi:hypothetical protein